eukprot:CAMPEP_0181088190 /NCGR_PEP_ID=MMETSP1071-20121207/6656_1 /TAXON_ID=35127 /ORGANISM="Thalassiosira sp., Strain NH16" /LENGTH=863 /DNA_ID=CAMNT_0023170093 /DNA_START=35 /DNA_END=2626 /DNA_ORIENTATION=+
MAEPDEGKIPDAAMTNSNDDPSSAPMKETMADPDEGKIPDAAMANSNDNPSSAPKNEITADLGEEKRSDTAMANHSNDDPLSAHKTNGTDIKKDESVTPTHSENGDEASAAAVASSAPKSSGNSTSDQDVEKHFNLKEVNGGGGGKGGEANSQVYIGMGHVDNDKVKVEDKQVSQDAVKEVAQTLVEQIVMPSATQSVPLDATNDAEMSGLSNDIDIDQALNPMRKSHRTRIPSVKLADLGDLDKPNAFPSKPAPRARIPSDKLAELGEFDKPKAVPSKPAPAPPVQPPPKTPQELYKRIKKSNDKLFFIAYSHNTHPLHVNDTKDSNTMEYQWYLVRVDLSTCQQLEETQNCQKNGKYYVEFYTKASYDQGILLAGNPLENGIPAAKMKPKPDSESRFWLQWHEYYFENGDMVVGKAKEFMPNSKKAIHRRLIDLSQRKRQGPSSPGSSNSSSEGEDRLMSEYHPDFDKYTTWADILDLMDEKTRLVGPFDFVPPPLKEEDLKIFNEETKKLFSANHSKLHVKDRVPLERWKDLLDSLKGRDIEPPKILVEKRNEKKKRISGGKRARDESMDREGQHSSKKWAQEERKGAVCSECGKGATEKDPFLHFPATSSRSSFHVRLSCGKNKQGKNRIVSKETMKDEISSMVEAVFTQTCQAPSGDGKPYYLLGELKEAMHKAFEGWAGGINAHGSSSRGAEVSSTMAKSSEPLMGLPEANFAEEDIESFPVAFAYHYDDPAGISEENAKIATLDLEVEQRQLKRNAGLSSSAASKSKKRSRKSHPIATEKDLQIPTEPAEGFPDGWVTRKIPRSAQAAAKSDRKLDLYYYSPKLTLKFRSKPAVHKFLEALKKSGGNEAVAIETVS